MTREELAVVMDRVFEECHQMREAGQKEYARLNENAFSNFNRVSVFLDDVTPPKALLTYAMKHLDGVIAWANGHRSQRENVRGRIIDLIVYLVLLYAMSLEEEGAEI